MPRSKKPVPKVVVSGRVEPEALKRLKKRAKSECRTVSEIVGRLVEKFA